MFAWASAIFASLPITHTLWIAGAGVLGAGVAADMAVQEVTKRIEDRKTDKLRKKFIETSERKLIGPGNH